MPHPFVCALDDESGAHRCAVRSQFLQSPSMSGGRGNLHVAAREETPHWSPDRSEPGCWSVYAEAKLISGLHHLKETTNVSLIDRAAKKIIRIGLINVQAPTYPHPQVFREHQNDCWYPLDSRSEQRAQ